MANRSMFPEPIAQHVPTACDSGVKSVFTSPSAQPNLSVPPDFSFSALVVGATVDTGADDDDGADGVEETDEADCADVADGAAVVDTAFSALSSSSPPQAAAMS